MKIARLTYCSHDGAIFSGTPEHEWHIGSSGQPLHPPGMTAEHLGGLTATQLMHTDLTVCCTADKDGVIGAWKELKTNTRKQFELQSNLSIQTS